MHIAYACVHTSPISFVTFPRPTCNKGNHGRRHAGYVRMRRALPSNVLILLTSLLLHDCVENFVAVTISEELTQSKKRGKEPSLVISVFFRFWFRLGQFDRH